jgi:uncharacterized membrane protein YfhO
MHTKLLLASSLLSIIGFSQSQNSQAKPVSDFKISHSEKAKTVTLSSNSTSNEPVIHSSYVWRNGKVSQVTKESELSNTQSLLQALNDKEAFLKSNPKTKDSPENIDWYAKAAVIRLKFESKITELSK